MGRARHVCPQEKASFKSQSMKQFGCLKIERRAERDGRRRWQWVVNQPITLNSKQVKNASQF